MWLPVTGVWLPVTGVWLPVTGGWLPVTGGWLPGSLLVLCQSSPLLQCPIASCTRAMAARPPRHRPLCAPAVRSNLRMWCYSRTSPHTAGSPSRDHTGTIDSLQHGMVTITLSADHSAWGAHKQHLCHRSTHRHLLNCATTVHYMHRGFWRWLFAANLASAFGHVGCTGGLHSGVQSDFTTWCALRHRGSCQRHKAVAHSQCRTDPAPWGIVATPLRLASARTHVTSLLLLVVMACATHPMHPLPVLPGPTRPVSCHFTEQVRAPQAACLRPP